MSAYKEYSGREESNQDLELGRIFSEARERHHAFKCEAETFTTTDEEIENDHFLAFKFAYTNGLTICGMTPADWYKFLDRFNSKMQEFLNENPK